MAFKSDVHAADGQSLHVLDSNCIDVEGCLLFAAGHARVYISFDILFRFLRRLGFNVTYVRSAQLMPGDE